MIDSHVHLRNQKDIENLEAIRRHIGFERMNIVCLFSREGVNNNPPAFAAKNRHPESFYFFGGLDHSAHFSGGKIKTPSLPEQVDRLMAIGADGIKMLENKPTHRRILDIPVDGPYFEEHFAHLEATGIPVVWHVCDPEEFWNPETTPSWAKSRGWGYDETFTPKEQLYAEVENVLKRHPRLRIIFAHFLFLSADLPRAASWLERFPNISLDLSPGIEFLYNLSKDVPATREFFIKHADRIVFGTDISSNHTLDEAAIRSGIVTRWLETDDERRIPCGADFVLGPPEDGVMRGLSLPKDALEKICRSNFVRLAGSKPKALNRDLAIAECERIIGEIKVLGGDTSEAVQSMEMLES